MPRGTVCVDPHCSMAIRAEHRSKFAALRRQWWRLQMVEQFSGVTEHSKQMEKKPKPLISSGKNVALFQKLWNFDFQWISLKKFGKLLYFTIRLLKKIWNWKKWYYTENHEIIPKTKELWFVMEKTMILCQKLWNYCKLKFKNKKSLRQRQRRQWQQRQRTTDKFWLEKLLRPL